MPPSSAAGAANVGDARKVHFLPWCLQRQPATSITALGQIFSKVSAGEVDVKVGRSLAYIASVLVKTTEFSDHEIRLRAIEQMMKSIKSMEDKR
jgi:hypothetical protein